MSKHTPGPWEFWNERANGDDTLNIQTTGNGELIAMVDTDWVLPITGGNHTANASLIAAAPDMAEALRTLKPLVECLYAEALAKTEFRTMICDAGTSALQIIDAAIAKAKAE